MSIIAENLRDWSGHDVLDSAGDKIGSLESVYFDTATDQPAFIGVQIGLPGLRKIVFAPVVDAFVSPRTVKLVVDKQKVKSALTIPTDGELTREQEPGLYAYYGLDYLEGAAGERRLGRR